MLIVISLALLALGLGELAALCGIWLRYAIPRAPKVFHWLLLVPMLASSTAAFALAWIALTGGESFFGVQVLVLLLARFAGAASWVWTLVAYAVYWHLRGYRCPA